MLTRRQARLLGLSFDPECEAASRPSKAVTAHVDGGVGDNASSSLATSSSAATVGSGGRKRRHEEEEVERSSAPPRITRMMSTRQGERKEIQTSGEGVCLGGGRSSLERSPYSSLRPVLPKKQVEKDDSVGAPVGIGSPFRGRIAKSCRGLVAKCLAQLAEQNTRPFKLPLAIHTSEIARMPSRPQRSRENNTSERGKNSTSLTDESSQPHESEQTVEVKEEGQTTSTLLDGSTSTPVEATTAVQILRAAWRRVVKDITTLTATPQQRDGPLKVALPTGAVRLPPLSLIEMKEMKSDVETKMHVPATTSWRSSLSQPLSISPHRLPVRQRSRLAIPRSSDTATGLVGGGQPRLCVASGVGKDGFPTSLAEVEEPEESKHAELGHPPTRTTPPAMTSAGGGGGTYRMTMPTTLLMRVREGQRRFAEVRAQRCYQVLFRQHQESHRERLREIFTAGLPLSSTSDRESGSLMEVLARMDGIIKRHLSNVYGSQALLLHGGGGSTTAGSSREGDEEGEGEPWVREADEAMSVAVVVDAAIAVAMERVPAVQRLMPHQKLGVRWLLHLNHAEKSNGILADEMGLGKTAQTILYLSCYKVLWEEVLPEAMQRVRRQLRLIQRVYCLWKSIRAGRLPSTDGAKAAVRQWLTVATTSPGSSAASGGGGCFSFWEGNHHTRSSTASSLPQQSLHTSTTPAVPATASPFGFWEGGSASGSSPRRSATSALTRHFHMVLGELRDPLALNRWVKESRAGGNLVRPGMGESETSEWGDFSLEDLKEELRRATTEEVMRRQSTSALSLPPSHTGAPGWTSHGPLLRSQAMALSSGVGSSLHGEVQPLHAAVEPFLGWAEYDGGSDRKRTRSCSCGDHPAEKEAERRGVVVHHTLPTYASEWSSTPSASSVRQSASPSSTPVGLTSSTSTTTMTSLSRQHPEILDPSRGGGDFSDPTPASYPASGLLPLTTLQTTSTTPAVLLHQGSWPSPPTPEGGRGRGRPSLLRLGLKHDHSQHSLSSGMLSPSSSPVGTPSNPTNNATLSLPSAPLKGERRGRGRPRKRRADEEASAEESAPSLFTEQDFLRELQHFRVEGDRPGGDDGAEAERRAEEAVRTTVLGASSSHMTSGGGGRGRPRGTSSNVGSPPDRTEALQSSTPLFAASPPLSDCLRPVLIVAPLSTLSQWKSEFTNFGVNHLFSLHVLNGSQEERQEEMAHFVLEVEAMMATESPSRETAGFHTTCGAAAAEEEEGLQRAATPASPASPSLSWPSSPAYAAQPVAPLAKPPTGVHIKTLGSRRRAEMMAARLNERRRQTDTVKGETKRSTPSRETVGASAVSWWERYLEAKKQHQQTEDNEEATNGGVKTSRDRPRDVSKKSRDPKSSVSNSSLHPQHHKKCASAGSNSAPGAPPTPVLIISHDLLTRKAVDFIRYIPHVAYEIMVVDEAQRIKSSQALLFHRLCALQTQARLVLTGTPLQNNVLELFSLIKFLMPTLQRDAEILQLMEKLNDGLSGLSSSFKSASSPTTTVGAPVMNGSNDEEGEEAEESDPATFTSAALPVDAADVSHQQVCRGIHQLLAPFLLRRDHRVIASLLPPKQDHLLLCPLLPYQQESLEAVEMARAEGTLRGNAHVHRRKILLHPYTRLPHFYINEDMINRSGKLLVLDMMMQFLQRTKHKFLIFCNWTLVLDVVETLCVWREMPYVRLDGSTSTADREKRIAQFNSSPTTPSSPTSSSSPLKKDSSSAAASTASSGGSPHHYFPAQSVAGEGGPSSSPSASSAEPCCFLISKTAGGVGLNLQSADTVFLLDVDYNPQRDRQALSRVYRVGQRREVRIYRLLIDHPVERRLLEIHHGKEKLDNAVIQAGLFDTRSSARERDDALQKVWEAEAADMGGDLARLQSIPWSSRNTSEHTAPINEVRDDVSQGVGGELRRSTERTSALTEGDVGGPTSSAASPFTEMPPMEWRADEHPGVSPPPVTKDTQPEPKKCLNEAAEVKKEDADENNPALKRDSNQKGTSSTTGTINETKVDEITRPTTASRGTKRKNGVPLEMATERATKPPSLPSLSSTAGAAELPPSTFPAKNTMPTENKGKHSNQKPPATAPDQQRRTQAERPNVRRATAERRAAREALIEMKDILKAVLIRSTPKSTTTTSTRRVSTEEEGEQRKAKTPDREVEQTKGTSPRSRARQSGSLPSPRCGGETKSLSRASSSRNTDEEEEDGMDESAIFEKVFQELTQL